MGAVGNAVERREDVDRLVVWVEGSAAVYGPVLPSHLDNHHWLRLATGLLRKNEDLAAVAVRNPASFKNALLECARLGHEPGTDAFAFVVYGNEIVGIEQYQGEIERMYRAGAVEAIHCEVVYQDDDFHWLPGELPTHKADWFAEDRGAMVGVYAWASFKGGGHSKAVVMSAAEVGKHRNVARTKVMWEKWPESMWRKTAIHELEKWVPTSAEYRRERARADAEATHVTVTQLPSAPAGEQPPATEEE